MAGENGKGKRTPFVAFNPTNGRECIFSCKVLRLHLLLLEGALPPRLLQIGAAAAKRLHSVAGAAPSPPPGEGNAFNAAGRRFQNRGKRRVKMPHLSLEDRKEIERLLRAGASFKAIAEAV